MSVQIRKATSVDYIAEVDLFLTRDGKLCGDKDTPAILLARKGSVIPLREVQRLGLAKETPKPQVVSPEEVETRATRPEKISAKR